MFYCVRVLGSSLNIAFSRIFRENALLAKVSGNEKYEKNKRRTIMIRRRFLSLAWQVFSKSVVDTIHFYCPAGAEKSRNDRLIEHVKQLLKIKVGGYYDGLFV